MIGLCLDPVQAGHTVQADDLALLDKVVVQFAVAADLAAFGPGFANFSFQAQSEYGLTPSRSDTSLTGRPRAVIFATALRLNSSRTELLLTIASAP